MNTHLDLKSEEFFSLNATGGQIEDGSPRLRDIQDMGHMLAMAAGTAERCDIELSRMVNLLRGAQNVGQTRVYLNAYGECVGFVAWAFLSPPVEREYLRGNRRPLGEWEYNEGTSAWILDLG